MPPPEAAADDAGSSGGGTPSGAGVEGTWTVDTASGEFDDESATGTFAGFRIEEELAGIGSTTAVGRTGDVTGSVTIDGSTLTTAAFEVDRTTITTNDGRRDDRVQSALETGTDPTATFTLTEPIELGDAASTGDAVSVVATGDLTIDGETRQVAIPIDAQLVDGTIVPAHPRTSCSPTPASRCPPARSPCRQLGETCRATVGWTSCRSLG